MALLYTIEESKRHIIVTYNVLFKIGYLIFFLLLAMMLLKFSPVLSGNFIIKNSSFILLIFGLIYYLLIRKPLGLIRKIRRDGKKVSVTGRLFDFSDVIRIEIPK